MKRIYKLFEEIEYVTKNMKEEMIDTIIGEIKDTINFYSNPREMCINLLKKNKENITTMNKVFEYLTGTWFCKQPMLISNNNISEFFKDIAEIGIDYLMIKMNEAFWDMRSFNIEQPFYIYIDGDDTCHAENKDEFIDDMIRLLEEEGEYQGTDMNKTYIDIIKIIKEN